jgi:NTP pyrophosphatase (non-canonical NTP hydrolase)
MRALRSADERAPTDVCASREHGAAVSLAIARWRAENGDRGRAGAGCRHERIRRCITMRLPALRTHPMPDSLHDLQAAQRAFADAREWGQFHTPRNLAAALSVEASELLEHFQWLTDEQSRQLSDDKKAQVGSEVADVLLYLLQLCDKLGIDPIEAARQKMQVNAAKYPVDRAKGRITKYTEL